MKVKAVLFDLDGTLLPMEQSVFARTYFSTLAKELKPRGYDEGELVDAIWAGFGAMMKNDGTRLNEDVFWNVFSSILGERVKEDICYFDKYYEEKFDGVSAVCGFEPKAKETVDKIRTMGLRTVLATNPLFPAIATEKRIKWAGLLPSDFELYTTFENSHFCKPNLKYYTEILEKLGLSPKECLMVGNDVSEDMVAQELGMKVFLMPKHLLNKKEKDISIYPQGDFDALISYIESLNALG